MATQRHFSAQHFKVSFYFSACFFKEITPNSKESELSTDTMNPERKEVESSWGVELSSISKQCHRRSQSATAATTIPRINYHFLKILPLGYREIIFRRESHAPVPLTPELKQGKGFYSHIIKRQRNNHKSQEMNMQEISENNPSFRGHFFW